MAYKAALANPNIVADVVEASEFPHLVQKYRVMGVPKTIINEKMDLVGAVPEDRFVSEILRAAEAS